MPKAQSVINTKNKKVLLTLAILFALSSLAGFYVACWQGDATNTFAESEETSVDADVTGDSTDADADATDNNTGSDTTASADSCDGVDFANTEGWTALTATSTSSATELNNNTNYYLGDDLAVAYLKVSINGTAQLCLNDHTITANGGTSSKHYGIYIAKGTLILGDGGNAEATGQVTLDTSATKSTYGVYISNSTSSGAELILNGGKITGFSYGGVWAGGELASFTMNGGEISGNTSKYAGSGVYLNDGASFTLNAGVISGNETQKQGGGVAMTSSYFTMNGGVVSSNTAGTSGGGVYGINSSELAINAGTISGNTSGSYGGGIYIESDSTLTSADVAIYHNTNTGSTSNSVIGAGGLYACPSGDVAIYATNGAVFYENYDTRGNNINEIFVDQSDANQTAFISNYHLGGGAYRWTDPDGNSVDANEVSRAGSDIRLNNALSADDAGVQKAMTLAQVFIYDNTAKIGGGIATNSTLIIGTERWLDVEVSLTEACAEGCIEEGKTLMLEFSLDGLTVATAELSAENNYAHTFADLEYVEGLSYRLYWAEDPDATLLSGELGELTYDEETGKYTVALEIDGECEKPEVPDENEPEPEGPDDGSGTETPGGSISPDTGDLPMLAVLMVLGIADMALMATFAVKSWV